jgi:hypothetical protein
MVSGNSKWEMSDKAFEVEGVAVADDLGQRRVTRITQMTPEPPLS